MLEPVRFQGTPPMITALAVNEIDVGLLGFTTMGLAIQNAGMDDLRIFANEFADGAHDHHSNEFMVRADSGIKSVADLKGKVLATNAAGSAVDVAMRAMLNKAGLVDKRDYTVVEAGFGAMKACYDRGLKRNPKLGGKLSVRITVNGSGGVGGVAVQDNTLGDPEVVSCMTATIRGWRFPGAQGGKSAAVEPTWVFKTAD